MSLAFAPTGKAESSSVGLFSQYFWLLLRVDLSSWYFWLLLLLRIFHSSKLNSLQFHLWELLKATACLPAKLRILLACDDLDLLWKVWIVHNEGNLTVGVLRHSWPDPLGGRWAKTLSLRSQSVRSVVDLNFFGICYSCLDCPSVCNTDQNIKREGGKWSNHCSERTGAAWNPGSPNISGWCESPGKGVLYRTSSPHIKTWNRVVNIFGTKLTELPQETFQKLLDDPIQNTRHVEALTNIKYVPKVDQ